MNDIILVGKTPLVKLDRIRKHFNCYPEIMAKLERNPSASSKTYCIFDVKFGEAEGLIIPGETTLIEVTSVLQLH